LACRKLENLDETVQNLKNYLYDYEDIGGMIIAFAEEGIDTVNQLISGYHFNPQKQLWENGQFTYPASIFRRSGVRSTTRNHLHSVIGNNIFNNYVFDKWEMYEWLSQFPKVNQHLPQTLIYEKPADLMWFLHHFGSAYVKPISGSQGMGIMKVSMVDEIVHFTYMKDKIDHKLQFDSEKEAMNFIKSHLTRGRFIIQQSIDVIRKNGAMIDFRVLLVKDYHGSWRDMGMIARYGVKESIVSNISSGGKAVMGEEVLREWFPDSEADVYEFRNQITQLVIEAAESMEKYGIHCGNLGLDLAIDTNKNVWIIEMNNKDPNHTIAIDASNRQLFYQTKKMNMLYAKKLAGF
jgi:hypothetical protein